MTAWTPERIAELTALIADDLTYGEIGRRMGMPKNAVLGKAHRLGIVHPGSPLRKRVAPAAALAPGAIKVVDLFPKVLRQGDALSTIARFDALDVFPGFGKCVFPKGNPGAPQFHFCGRPLDDPMRSYCPDHSRICFTKGPMDGWSEEKKAAARVKMAAMRAAKGAGA